MSKSKTHFEQIPISAVKKSVQIITEEKETAGEHDPKRDHLKIQHSRQKMEPYSVRTNSHVGD